jgi:hypothetical protein
MKTVDGRFAGNITITRDRLATLLMWIEKLADLILLRKVFVKENENAAQ